MLIDFVAIRKPRVYAFTEMNFENESPIYFEMNSPCLVLILKKRKPIAFNPRKNERLDYNARVKKFGDNFCSRL